MRKRLSAFIAITVLVFSFCINYAFAFENRASKTLTSYGVTLAAGKTSGEIRISYDVCASKIADSVGISTLEIYKSNGIRVSTITGTTRNGLVNNDNSCCMSTYSYTGSSGTSYYVVATVFAEIGDDYDSRVVTTKIVTAP